ncbi:probable RNA-binding protein EIF1AD isoform X2 [Phalaenopsis equestris]|uniref:probable RNA-binding protein EIF1AD isoform X2 n=1 Tax=Phalaenopsis equestris TaxID=78828 RepID=UPI0009E1A879|nr:probable RNA-binding protein EIF1AD isoform X2 [Phalaenopsis equestris]
MKSGRKNLRKASVEDGISLQEGQSIMQVVSLRGSNVMDAEGVKSLALFPAKFQRSFWIKTGNFVIVDEGGREKALESGEKIACIVSQVLFHAQVRSLEKSPDWPANFKNARPVESQTFQLQPELVLNSDSDEDLPPLEANLNRRRPVDIYSDSASDSDHHS